MNPHFDKTVTRALSKQAKLARELFVQYMKKYKSSDEYDLATRNEVYFFNSISSEVFERLCQMEVILKTVIKIDRKFSISSSRDALLKMRISTEAYYYQAFRVYKIFEAKEKLPKLGGFSSKGVRDVRNHLIEHPVSYFYSFGCGGKSGPALKPSRSIHESKKYPDHGLYKNAAEFYSNLSNMLSRHLPTI